VPSNVSAATAAIAVATAASASDDERMRATGRPSLAVSQAAPAISPPAEPVAQSPRH
jgi:hypothetical protein